MKGRKDREDFEQLHPNNPFILYSKSKDSFSCKEHADLNLVNRGTTVRHSKTAHMMDLEGKRIAVNEEPEVEPESLAEGEWPLGKDPIIERIESIRQKRGNAEENSEPTNERWLDPAYLVLGNINKEIVDGATAIAGNILIRYFYLQTKPFFPPQWNFADWVEFALSKMLEDWGISFSVYQNLDGLSDSQLKAIHKAREEWGKEVRDYVDGK